MSDAKYTVTIVGGGTAGWITAGLIAAAHDCTNGRMVVRLIESPDVSPIGVGEGTWPTMRATLRAIGVSEHDFMQCCNASFKQGSLFKGWRHSNGEDFYHHPFELPVDFFKTNPAAAWLASAQNHSFSKSVCAQEYFCEAHLSPKSATTPEFAGVSNYGYHLDAGKFSTFLKEHCTKRLGVEYISDTVIDIDSEDDGTITAVNTKHHGPVSGNLFVDCTGFNSILLGQHFGISVALIEDQLFVDTALATQVPHHEGEPIKSQTISTARAAGWIWDIGLANRRGTGYVYSSSHMSNNDALEDFRTYLDLSEQDFSKLSVRTLRIKSGYRKEFWKKNCVAVGLAAGFIEPLEASAIVMAEMSAKMISTHLPLDKAAMPILAKRFNDTFHYHWRRIVDFLKLHYVLSERDEPFWIDNRAPSSISDRLREDLEFWRNHAPWTDDFVRKDEIFPAASYQYILYGMGYATKPGVLGLSLKEQETAQNRVAQIERFVDTGFAHLQTNNAALGHF